MSAFPWDSPHQSSPNAVSIAGGLVDRGGSHSLTSIDPSSTSNAQRKRSGITPKERNAQCSVEPLTMTAPPVTFKVGTTASKAGTRATLDSNKTQTNLLRNHEKRRAVRHNDAVLTYAPTY